MKFQDKQLEAKVIINRIMGSLGLEKVDARALWRMLPSSCCDCNPCNTDVYEYNTCCMYRTMQSLESTIDGDPYINTSICQIPVKSLILPEVFTFGLNGSYSAGETAGALANSSYLDTSKWSTDGCNLQLTVLKGESSPGNLSAQLYKRYTFDIYYLVEKYNGGANPAHDRNVDENISLTTAFDDISTNPAVGGSTRNTHFYHGIYGTLNGNPINLFNNTSFRCMFRHQFSEFKADHITLSTGLKYHTNRGFNEIGGNDPLTLAAYYEWKRQLIDHVSIQATDQGFCTVCQIVDGNVVDTTDRLIRNAKLIVDVAPDIILTSINTNNLSSTIGIPSTNAEWNFANDGIASKAISDWTYNDILLIDANHEFAATLDTTVGTVTIEPSLNGVGGSTDFEEGCVHPPYPSLGV